VNSTAATVSTQPPPAQAVLLMAAAYLRHVHGFSGKLPSLDYQWLPLAAWRVYPMLALAALPLAAAHWLAKAKPRYALALLAFSLPLLQLAGSVVTTKPYGLDEMVQAIESPIVTSYHTDAIRFIDAHVSIRQILREYAAVLPNFNVHGREKPPGPVLFYSLLLRTLGRTRTVALLAGFFIALVTALAVPSIYHLARFLGFDSPAAFHAAALFCLCPGVSFFFPQFDTCYPALVCVQALAWGFYLRTGRWRYLLALAGLLWLATFWAYNVLVFGVFLAGVFFLELRQTRAAFTRLMHAAYLIPLFFLLAYGLLYVAADFDPIATFQSALAQQKKADLILKRSFPQTLPNDLLEFSIGAGWGAVLAAGFGSLSALRQRPGATSHRAAVLICLVQILVVAATGLLKCETARVWIFLLPLLAIPGGAEIAGWPPRWRAAFYAASWLAMAAVLANILRFVA